jgi:xylulokinase
MQKNKFLGLDLSTQSLTALVVDLSEASVVFQTSLAFDAAYPSYGTRGGVVQGKNPRVVHVDPRMWIEAIDDVLASLGRKKLTKEIAAVGVSAQQHGSVYLNDQAWKALGILDPGKPFLPQLKGVFSRPTAPVWMDSSTHKECKEITKFLGGDARTAFLTGSKATERFTGPQIRKFWKENPTGYDQTAHIALVSSFVTSLLLGLPAPLDCGDGFGTNLADIHTGRWSRKALAATAPRLRKKLPDLVRGDVCLGKVSPYLVKRYGFSPETEIVIGTGDNPGSLAGLGLVGDKSRHAVSLGTSDTYFGYLSGLKKSRSTEGHIFGAADGRYMFLLCFKNGSLAREAVRNQYRLTWDEFSEILFTTPPGNGGRIMLPYFLPEITPLVLAPAVRRFGGLKKDDTKGNVRAVAEGQIMSMFLHSRRFGVKGDAILVTAGGSENRGLLQVIADIFGQEVRTFEVKDSAALGAAVRAAKAHLGAAGDPRTWSDLAEIFIRTKRTKPVFPRNEASRVYHGENGLLSVYEACEQYFFGRGVHPRDKIRRFRSGV